MRLEKQMRVKLRRVVDALLQHLDFIVLVTAITKCV